MGVVIAARRRYGSSPPPRRERPPRRRPRRRPPPARRRPPPRRCRGRQWPRRRDHRVQPEPDRTSTVEQRLGSAGARRSARSSRSSSGSWSTGRRSSRRDAPADLSHPETGCLRSAQPCLGYRASAISSRRSRSARSRAAGPRWWSSPARRSWAASPASGCERPQAGAKSRAPTAAALPPVRAADHGPAGRGQAGGRDAELLQRLERAQPPRVRQPAARGVRPHVALARARHLRAAVRHAQGHADRGQRRRADRGRGDRRAAEVDRVRDVGAGVHRRAAAGRRVRHDRLVPARLHRRAGPGAGGRRGARGARLPAAVHDLDHGDRRRPGAARPLGRRGDHRRPRRLRRPAPAARATGGATRRSRSPSSTRSARTTSSRPGSSRPT